MESEITTPPHWTWNSSERRRLKWGSAVAPGPWTVVTSQSTIYPLHFSEHSKHQSQSKLTNWNSWGTWQLTEVGKGPWRIYAKCNHIHIDAPESVLARLCIILKNTTQPNQLQYQLVLQSAPRLNSGQCKLFGKCLYLFASKSIS